MASSSPDTTIGDRLRRLRTERGPTQESLAGHAGVSVDLVKKLEQGRRASARLTSLTALANALDVSLAELTDKRPRLDAAGDRLVLDLRDALLTPSALPGIDVGDDAGNPTPLPDLTAAIDSAWVDYWVGRFVDLARVLPRLLGEARITAHAGGTGAGRALAQTYQLTADLLVHLGRDDLAAVAAERAAGAAGTGDDELLPSVMAATYAWVLLHQGRAAESAALAARVAENIEPKFSTARPAHITAWGGLLLTATAAAAAGGDGDTVDELVTLAGAGAARLGIDRRDYQTTFGPVRLAAELTHTRVMLGQPDRALSAAAGVHPGGLRTMEYGRHLIDVAHAHAEAHRADHATEALRQARNVGGRVWFRHQGPARSLVADLAERHSRLTPSLRDLVTSLDVR